MQVRAAKQSSQLDYSPFQCGAPGRAVPARVHPPPSQELKRDSQGAAPGLRSGPGYAGTSECAKQIESAHRTRTTSAIAGTSAVTGCNPSIARGLARRACRKKHRADVAAAEHWNGTRRTSAHPECHIRHISAGEAGQLRATKSDTAEIAAYGCLRKVCPRGGTQGLMPANARLS
jgi:hypothetical protein